MYWLMGRNSHLSLHNKLLIYKQILRPIWTYGIQLWGCAKKSNIKTIQTRQNIILRSIVQAPWFMRNDDIHRDLRVEMVTEIIAKYARKHEHRLHKHENLEMLNVLNNEGELRRLKRNKPLDLIVLCK
uniref:RNA-directed DNA polymerase from transposon X-element n=2 Tax=Lygus hesperus TaxID=30085 RepID=A0A0K8T2N3_LYGHE